MAARTVRTTISLPVDLMEAADKAVRSGIARSRNDLVVAALRRELAAQKRAAIDDSFSRMAHDEEYLAETRAIADEFAEADWEAFCLADKELRLHYYPETDSLYVELNSKPSVDSREIDGGLVLDLDAEGNVVGIDIDHASQKFDLQTIETIALPVVTVSPR
jgi:uncharacterized protein YuzE/Arc/MetJ-type ribon-helix-helix transcriptional regulator